MFERLIGEDLELNLQLEDPIGAVKADRGQLEQVMLNLATNARDAMPSGGRVIVRTANVNVGRSWITFEEGLLPGAYVLIEVTDTGIGMDEVTRNRIFDPFFTTKDPGKGTGLGLSTVYSIVRQSGGSIHVYSEPGRGTTFRIYLPRVDREMSSASEDAEPVHLSMGSETILVVEDNEPLREMIGSVLSGAHYSTIVCADGAAAIEEMRSGAAVDAALLDVVLPRMSGMELAEQLRLFKPETKVLFMSGYSEEAVRSGPSAVEAGMQFIQKPFSVYELCARLRQLLDAPLVS